LGLVPDFLIRFGIRIQLRDRLALLRSTETTAEQDDKMQIVRQLHTMPIAVMTKEANDQHYEVPARFYDLCLGPCKKYSSGLWPTSRTTFEESEILMLDLYCERAELEDGMSIVDLGCGWGSLTLHLCAKYPNAKITSISNSHTQKDYILNTAKARGLNHQNIKVITVRCPHVALTGTLRRIHPHFTVAHRFRTFLPYISATSPTMRARYRLSVTTTGS
jgi:cyclopropane-fatty-acyl-phospholipid synthase